MVMEVTGGRGGIDLVPRDAWAGAAFLADRWELDDRRIREQLGFKPCRDAGGRSCGVATGDRRDVGAPPGARNRDPIGFVVIG